MFQNEFALSRKEPTTGVRLCVFLGGLGTHRFWMGQFRKRTTRLKPFLLAVQQWKPGTSWRAS